MPVETTERTTNLKVGWWIPRKRCPRWMPVAETTEKITKLEDGGCRVSDDGKRFKMGTRDLEVQM